MYFDTHAHYNDKQFDEDRDELLASMPERGIELIVNPGSSMRSSRKSLELSDKYPFMYAAVGVHPHDAKSMTEADLEEILAMTEHPKVVAVGEIGLDYYYDHSPREIQQARFRDQLQIARMTELPVIIHEREACKDCLDILTEFPDVCGVFHCFAESWETAKLLLDKGWHLSFTGSVTFKNARRAPEVIQKMPIDRLMLETDSPYMAPVPMRGKRNSSLNLPYIAQVVADLRSMTTDEVARVTTENGKRFFGIG